MHIKLHIFSCFLTLSNKKNFLKKLPQKKLPQKTSSKKDSSDLHRPPNVRGQKHKRPNSRANFFILRYRDMHIKLHIFLRFLSLSSIRGGHNLCFPTFTISLVFKGKQQFFCKNSQKPYVLTFSRVHQKLTFIHIYPRKHH